MRVFGSIAVLSAVCLASCASIQQTQQSVEPNYGTITLQAGFHPDPRVVSLRAGGDLSARDRGDSCRGYITDPPDIRLNYAAGSLPLIISVAAASDTTLIVVAPDGRLHCNDDGGVNGLNPSIRFNSPASGGYDIWVGTYRAGVTVPARLHISEVSSQ